MEPVQDFFTLTDRKELMLQGLKLDEIKSDMLDLKVLFNEAIKQHELNVEKRDNAFEKRIRSLEDAQLKMSTSVNNARWLATLLGGILGAAIAELSRKYIP